MPTIHDVAAYILAHFKSSISPMKLQKLTFFSQGWHLAFIGERLFDEEFQAWTYGPVSNTLFQIHKGDWSVKNWALGNAELLSSKEKLVVDAVLRNYGALSGRELSELTHQPGTPWSTTREQAGVAEGEPSQAVIDQEVMAKYFKETLLKK